MTFLSFLEIDLEGNVNVSKLGKKPYLTAGCGGFVDITARARKIVFAGQFEAGAQLEIADGEIRVAKPGKFPKMVEKVEHVTFSGRRARELGQEVLYVTERCVIRLTDEGLVATEIMPGIDPQRDIVEASLGRVRLAPDAKVLPASLLGTGPMGLVLEPKPAPVVASHGADARRRARWGWRRERAAPDRRGRDRRAAARQSGEAERADRADARGARRPLRDAGAEPGGAGGHPHRHGRERLLHRGRHRRLGPMAPFDFARHWVREGHRIFDRLARLGKPTIAALNGHAFGGGLELAAACDIRVIAPRATLALPEAGVGIVPGWSGTQRVARLLPEPVVKEMALFGRRIAAERAVALGFAAEVAEDVRRGGARDRGEGGDPVAARGRGREVHDPGRRRRGPSGADRGARQRHDRRERGSRGGRRRLRAKRKPEFPGR